MNNFNAENVGKRIREKRKEYGLSREKLGNLIGGITKQHIYRIEKGKQIMSAEILCKISIVLNVSADWLLFGDKEKSPPVKDIT